MSIKKPRGRTSFCRRIYHMCQPFLYDMCSSESSHLLRNGDGSGMWMTFVTSVTSQSLMLIIAADKPRRFFLNQVWFYSAFSLILVQACSHEVRFYSYWLTTRIKARNSQNTSNAPSWYAASHNIQRREISHFIWTLITQPPLPLWHLQLRLYRLLTGYVGDAFSPPEIAAVLRWGFLNCREKFSNRRCME